MYKREVLSSHWMISGALFSPFLPPLQLPPRFLQIPPDFLAYISSYRLAITTWISCKFLRLVYSRSFHNPFTFQVCSSPVNDAATPPISDPRERARFTSDSFLSFSHPVGRYQFSVWPFYPIGNALIQMFMVSNLDYCNIVLISSGSL